MYEFNRNAQISLYDFNQPIGLKMNPKNCWGKKAETIPGEAIEERYAEREGHYLERVLVTRPTKSGRI